MKLGRWKTQIGKNVSEETGQVDHLEWKITSRPCFLPDGWSACDLCVLVLQLGDKSGKYRNAFVRLTLGSEKEQTGVQFNQKDPIWGEYFQLLSRNPEADELLIEVGINQIINQQLSVILPINLSIYPIKQPIDQPIRQPISQSINQFINQSINQPTNLSYQTTYL